MQGSGEEGEGLVSGFQGGGTVVLHPHPAGVDARLRHGFAGCVGVVPVVADAWEDCPFHLGSGGEGAFQEGQAVMHVAVIVGIAEQGQQGDVGGGGDEIDVQGGVVAFAIQGDG